MSEFTRIIASLATGETRAADELLALVYDELRNLAGRRLAGESGTQTLQPTALVHEAWLRLGGDTQPTWQNQTHFFRAAAEAMRRILIDRARSKRAWRHGGGLERRNLAEVEIPAPQPDDKLLAVSDALDRFAREEPEKAELVKLRYFVGLTLGEAAQVLGISEPTAVRWWTFSKTWLFHAIRTQGAVAG
jgi:RNA polymerase sigma factor (TIGR02999 family)